MSEPQKRIAVSGSERTDLGEGFIWGVVGLCLVVLVACAVTVAWLYPRSGSDRLIAPPLPDYPAPRLQANPVADMDQFRQRQLQELNATGWIDRSQGIAHIPIGSAMQQIAAEGIADWPAP